MSASIPCGRASSRGHDCRVSARLARPELHRAAAALRRADPRLGVAASVQRAFETVQRPIFIRAHGAREEILLYPWMDRELDATTFRRRRSVGGAAAAPCRRGAGGLRDRGGVT